MRKLSVVFGSVLILGLMPQLPASAVQTGGQLRITEIKLGESKPATEEPLREFVEIYNPNSIAQPLANIRLEHAKPGFDSLPCGQTWSGSAIKSYQLSGNLAPKTLLIIEIPLTDTAAGSLRIAEETNDSMQVHDLIGWGNTAPCFIGSPADLPAKGKSLHRYLACDIATLADFGANKTDFGVLDTPTPGSLGTFTLPSCQNTTPTQPPDTSPHRTCEGIVISEILPNPSGTDTGREFIELYNATNHTIPLGGCGLQANAKTTVYRFANDDKLAPGAFRAYYDSTTGLTLANTSGGTVFLLATDDTETTSATYPGEMDDDTSWSWFGDSHWEVTYSPTPNANNSKQPLKPCPQSDQVRSTETGRCHSTKTEDSSALTPCKPGQERNPETNRCRGTSATATPLKPCKPAQVRNPETNRCRSAASAASSLKPCAPGQVRNPETNRCRKAGVNGAHLPKVDDVQSPLNAGGWQWWAIGLATTGAVGYGAYEWRHSIRRQFDKLRGKAM